MTKELLTARDRLLAGVPVKERTIEAAGIPTAIVEGGRGDPLLLLHGPGEHVLKWLPVLPSLVSTGFVVAPDLPGHGATGTPDEPLTIDRVTQWVDEVIAATCPSPPTVIGSLVGGAIALRYAAEHGDRVRRLVVVDTLGLAPFHPAPEFGAVLEAYLAAPSEATFERLMGRCSYDLDGLRGRMGEGWQPLVEYTLDRIRAPGARESLDAFFELLIVPEIPAETLARIGAPVTLVWGRQDLATDLSVAQSASARYGWPLHVIEGSGDDPVMDQPERFLEVLRRL